jgi:hypothetical protein
LLLLLVLVLLIVLLQLLLLLLLLLLLWRCLDKGIGRPLVLLELLLLLLVLLLLVLVVLREQLLVVQRRSDGSQVENGLLRVELSSAVERAVNAVPQDVLQRQLGLRAR